MTNQPDWKFVGLLGDQGDPIEFGGTWVYIDRTGVYPPEAEYVQPPYHDPPYEGKDKRRWTVSRFILDKIYLVENVITAMRPGKQLPHPYPSSYKEWWADYLDEMCLTNGMKRDDFLSLIMSDDPMKRAAAWQMIGEYHGMENLDSYPITLSHDEIEARHPRSEWRNNERHNPVR